MSRKLALIAQAKLVTWPVVQQVMGSSVEELRTQLYSYSDECADEMKKKYKDRFPLAYGVSSKGKIGWDSYSSYGAVRSRYYKLVQPPFLLARRPKKMRRLHVCRSPSSSFWCLPVDEAARIGN